MKDFKLDNHPKINSGFQVPDSYFDSFPDKVMMQLPEKESKVISIFRNKKVWITSAAAVLILALMIPFFNPSTVEEPQLDSTAIENYLSYNTNISQYELANLLDKNDLEKLETDINIEDKTIEDILISNNNFENYIID